jgi:hypothetical protein
MARPKSLTEIVVPLGTRIKLDTAKRLDDFCVKNRENKEMTKGNLLIYLINWKKNEFVMF